MNAASKKALYLRELNNKLRSLQLAKDCIAKRLLAMQTDFNEEQPGDARGKETVPYAQARIDIVLLPGTHGSSTLNIEIACGFLDY